MADLFENTKPLLLIIDDIPDNIEVLGGTLVLEYNVQFATSGAEGLAIIQTMLPDLILLDVLMPLMDGYAVFAELQRSPRTRDIPVIFVTAQNDAENESRALSVGAVDFISKPLNQEVVRARVKTHLSLRQREIQCRQLNEELENRVVERTQQVVALNEALEERALHAEAANFAKSLFIGSMSHELRTPMSAIIGFSELLQLQITEPEQVKQLANIHKAALHLSTTINDILNFTDIQSGKISQTQAVFELNALMQRIYAVHLERANLKKLHYSYHIDPAIPQFLFGDAAKLEQILLNLLSNAIKFTQTGAIALSVQLQQINVEDVQLLFAVQDTGVGIEASKLEPIFKPFQQADNSLTREYGGIGLGLAINQKLLALLDGQMGVESEFGQGSRFWITVKLQRSDVLAPAVAPLASALERLQELSRKPRILLVDDDEFNQSIFSALLTEAGLAFEVANDGIEAFPLVKAEHYDLILMDVQMPIMDGLTTTRLIRSLPDQQQVPIVAISANAFAEDQTRCFDAGMNAFLAKPVTPTTFYEELAQWLITDD